MLGWMKQKERPDPRFALEQHGSEGKMKPVFEALGEEYDYGVLKCVQAALLSGKSDR